MSTDRTQDTQIHQSRTPTEVPSSTGGRFSPGITVSAETEISDETLEAVAGGGIDNPGLKQSAVDPS